MEKKILYLLVIVLSAYTIYMNVNPLSNQKKIVYGNVLKVSAGIEDLNRGRTFLNVNLIDHNNNEVELHSIISNYSSEYCIAIVSSLRTCSLCREQILNMWNQLYKKDNTIPMFLIISESEPMSREELRKAKASIFGLKIEIPFYIEKDSALLNDFGVSDNQTPLSVILSHDKKIIAIDRATQISIERSQKFRDFFMLLCT